MLMGKVWSYMKRPLINYAVEERASKVLDKEKPKMHPLHATEEKVLRKIEQEHPELKLKIKEKNELLDSYLKQVKVKSFDVLPGVSQKHLPPLPHSIEKMLEPPDDLKIKTMVDYGLPAIAPNRIPPGKLSFNQAVELFRLTFNENKLPPDELDKSIEEYAIKNFKLEPERTRLMLKYFKPFFTAVDYEREQIDPMLDEVKKSNTFGKLIKEHEQIDASIQKERRESYQRVQNVNRSLEKLKNGDTKS